MQYLDPDSAIKSIFSDDQWLVKTGIGGMAYAASLLLLLLNFFTLPLVILLLSCVQGYLLRVIRNEVAMPGSKLPGWNDPADLFVSGLTWVAIGTVIVGTACLIIFGLALILSWQSMPQVYPHSLWLGVTVTIAGALLCAITSFLLTFLMVNLAVEENNQAGFKVSAVFKKASSRRTEFIASWIISEGIKVYSFWLPVATIIGAFLLPSTMFIAQIVAAKLAAQVWAEQTAVGAPSQSRSLDPT